MGIEMRNRAKGKRRESEGKFVSQRGTKEASRGIDYDETFQRNARIDRRAFLHAVVTILKSCAPF